MNKKQGKKIAVVMSGVMLMTSLMPLGESIAPLSNFFVEKAQADEAQTLKPWDVDCFVHKWVEDGGHRQTQYYIAITGLTEKGKQKLTQDKVVVLPVHALEELAEYKEKISQVNNRYFCGVSIKGNYANQGILYIGAENGTSLHHLGNCVNLDNNSIFNMYGGRESHNYIHLYFTHPNSAMGQTRVYRPATATFTLRDDASFLDMPDILRSDDEGDKFSIAPYGLQITGTKRQDSKNYSEYQFISEDTLDASFFWYDDLGNYSGTLTVINPAFTKKVKDDEKKVEELTQTLKVTNATLEKTMKEKSVVETEKQDLETKLVNTKEALEKEKQDNDKNKETIKNLSSEIETTKANLQEKENELNKEKQINQEHQATIAKLQKNLKEKESDLKEKQELLEKEKQSNIQNQATIAKLQSEVEQLTQALQENKDLLEKEKQANEKNKELIKGLETEKQDLENTVAKLQEEKTALTNKVDSLTQEKVKLEQAIQDKEMELKEKVTLIESLETNLQNKTLELAKLNELLKSKVEQINDLEKKVKQQSKELEELKIIKGNLEKTTKELEKKLEEAFQIIKEKNLEIDKLKAELLQTQKELIKTKIEMLANLSKEKREAYKTEVDKQKTKEAMNKILDKAKAENNDNLLKNKAKAELDNLQYLSKEEKEKLLKELEANLSEENLEKVLEKARKYNKEKTPKSTPSNSSSSSYGGTSVNRIADKTKTETKQPINSTQTINRAKIATLLADYLKLEDVKDNSFIDVSSKLKDYIAISKVNKAGLMIGDNDNRFRPEDELTRAEFTVIVSKLAKNEKAIKDIIAFNDISEKHWANSYIKDVSSKGLVVGYEDGSFRPNQTVTEKEVKLILERLVNKAK